MKDSSLVPPRSNLEIALEAYQFLQRVASERYDNPGPLPVADLLEFELEDLFGYEFDVQELQPPLEATTDASTKELIVSHRTYKALVRQDDPRARFTIMHEIGHIVLHAPYLRWISARGKKPQRFNRGTIPAYMDSEHQADVFAAAALMPQRAVAKVVEACRRRGFSKEETINEISRVFRVSYSAAGIRLRNFKKF